MNARSASRSPSVVGMLLVASLVGVLFAAPASAAPVVYDNTGRQYDWDGRVYSTVIPTINTPGNYLDVTLAPTNQPADVFVPFETPLPKLFGFSAEAGGNVTPGHYNVVAGQGAGIALGAPKPVNDVNNPGATATPPRELNGLDLVGPTMTFGSAATVAYGGGLNGLSIVFPSHGFIGVSVNLADGVHYGFIEMTYDLNNPDIVEANRWGYETFPGVPFSMAGIAPVPEPGATAVVGLAGLLVLRRRR